MRRALIPKAATHLLAGGAAPLTADECAQRIQTFIPFPPSRRLAIAVSGGPDSMALAYSLTQWAGTQHLLALIVDHGLRPESAIEAENTKKGLEKIGITAEILRWDHAPVRSKLHATARKARYRLLIEACHRHDIGDLLFAHQREDQAETILMRFAKGSGIDGLCGMEAQSYSDGIRILRPLLDVPKERLIATCETAQVSFVVDPSNKSEKFARSRLRRVLPLLAEEGLTIERLIDLGVRASEARDALDHYAQALLRAAATISVAGALSINLELLRASPRATSLRVLNLCLNYIQADDYAPERASVLPLLDALCHAADMEARTLQGCLITKHKAHAVIMREYAAINDATVIHSGETTIWDKRWHVTLAKNASDVPYTVRPLGNPPHDFLDTLAPDLRDKVPQGRIRACLPALWLGDELALIPSLVEFGPSVPAYARIAKLWP